MRTRLRSGMAEAALVATFALANAGAASAPAAEAGAEAGTVHALRAAGSEFNQFTSEPSSQMKSWLTSHFWRMLVFSPYFDSRTSWYPNGWMYKDAYAIYDPSALANQHPEWIFKDTAGNNLYIPFACNGTSCTQYAGNIASAAFRQHWIEEARAELAHGYRGMYLDDVNMEFRVSNAKGEQVPPVDPATGNAMTYAAWRQYMAQFMEQIRAAFPNTEIVHNVIWFSDMPERIADPFIEREIKAANGVYLERGVVDGGLTGGEGVWSVNAFLAYAEAVNSLGRFFVLGNASKNQSQQEYNLAAYFLLSSGADGIDVGASTPREWWPGWEAQLGRPAGARYTWHGMWRRDFAGGIVLLNAPGEPSQTVDLDQQMRTASGKLVSSVTVAPATGVVLSLPVSEEPHESGSGAGEGGTGGGGGQEESSSPEEAPPGESGETPKSEESKKGRSKPAKSHKHRRRHRHHRGKHHKPAIRAVDLRAPMWGTRY